MEKNKVKFYLDILLLIDFILVTFSGFVLKVIYPAGERSGRAGVIFLFDRFQWIEIHVIISIILILLLIIHLILNWTWIKCMLFKPKEDKEKSKQLDKAQTKLKF